MNRRDFLETSAVGLALAASRAGAHGASQIGAQAGTQAGTQAGGQPARPQRVGLIGCGWYGKCDLLRLVQIAPVEVVSLCDVDKRMLAQAADIVATRQASKKKPRTCG